VGQTPPSAPGPLVRLWLRKDDAEGPTRASAGRPRGLPHSDP